MPNIYCILTFFQVARQCFVITTCKITYCLVFREILHCLFDPSAVMYQQKIVIFRGKTMFYNRANNDNG